MNQYRASQHGNTRTLSLYDRPPGQGRGLGISFMREESGVLLPEPMKPEPRWLQLSSFVLLVLLMGN